jgi:hypothetical protein
LKLERERERNHPRMRPHAQAPTAKEEMEWEVVSWLNSGELFHTSFEAHSGKREKRETTRFDDNSTMRYRDYKYVTSIPKKGIS